MIYASPLGSLNEIGSSLNVLLRVYRLCGDVVAKPSSSSRPDSAFDHPCGLARPAPRVLAFFTINPRGPHGRIRKETGVRHQRRRHDRPGRQGRALRAAGREPLVTPWKGTLQGEAKTNFAGTIGSSLDEAVAPGLITVGLTKDPHQMQVHTYDPAGKPAKRPFHIAVFRD